MRDAQASKRFAVALVSWSLAGVGVLSSVMLAGSVLAGDRVGPAGVIAVLPLVAWLCLAVMTARWIQGRRCHWMWLIAGTLSGLACALAFYLVFFVYVAAVPLAVYLVWWHLGGPERTVAGP
jgi:hypothetical protein